MTAAPARTVLVDLAPADLRIRLDEALDVYVRAMRYPPGTARQRAPMWSEHTSRPGWRGVAALDDAGVLRGIAYGYPGARGQWWFEEVSRGLSPGRLRLPGRRAASARERGWLDDYFELTELHVAPEAQGLGTGEALLRRLLGPVGAGAVLLSTPETSGASRAWSLYRRLGFRDVLRHHRFSSDPRPFAVLGRPLPLDPGPLDRLPPDAGPDGTSPDRADGPPTR